MSENSKESFQHQSEVKKMMIKLSSLDKKVRKQTLQDLEDLLSKTEFTTEELRDIFNETHMHTLNCMRDKTESVREQAIKFATFLIIGKLPLNDFYLTYVFPILVERVGSVEIIEESEEIRLQLIEFLRAIIEKYSNTQQLVPFLNDSVIILKESLKDKHPAIKEASSKCTVELAQALPRNFHMQAENLVKSLLSCFGHQRFKVRVEAVKAIGEVVIHSSYNALNESVGPLAERLFDQIPVVRRTVAQVAFRWLTEYRDRYSFFHKILPLLLTGLNDEVEETRAESHALWEKVGLQYQQENEKDLKNQLDFPLEPSKYYPNHLKRPNLGCRTLVKRNIGKLTKALSVELSSWQDDIRVRCSQLLCALALHAEESLTHHLQELLPAIYSSARDHDQRVVSNIVRACEIVGIFVPTDVWIKLVLPAIEDQCHSGHLCVLSSLITGSCNFDSKILLEITGVLAEDSICYTRKKLMQLELLKCVKIIGGKLTAENRNSDVDYNLFKISISIIALKDVENCNTITTSLITDLAKFFQLSDEFQVWSLNLNRLLEEINRNPNVWTEVTPQRCIFEVILLESAEAFGENLNLIGAILEETLDPESDPESRLKTFLALSNAFDAKDVIFKRASNLGIFFEKLILGVFVPALVWHAGLTAEALRTMSANCLLCALSPQKGVELFPDVSKFRNLFDRLLPLLLSLTEDASYRSRYLGIECLKVLKIHATTQKVWSADDLIKIYPEILKRLDDPTDKVRICGLSSLVEIFKDAPESFKEPHYRAHHELIIDTLFTHFDDDEEEIQKIVFDILKVMVDVNQEELCRKVERHKPLVRNQKGCDEVLDYLKTLKVS